MLQCQQVGEVFAPLGGNDGSLIEVIVKTGRAQVVLRGDAVEVEMRKRPRAAVIIDDGKGRTADRIGAAQPLGQTFAEGSLACTQTAGKRDESTRLKHRSQFAPQCHGLFAGMRDKFRHR